MGKGASLAWANFLQTIGAQTPGIVQRYDEQQTAYDKAQKDLETRRSVSDIMRGMPQVGTSMLDELAGGMDPATATKVLQLTPPETKRQALETFRLVVPKNIPSAPGLDGALESISTPQNPRHAKNAFVNRFMDTIGAVESGGQDIGAHPRAKNGAQAFGRFGVVPEFHAQRVGLDPTNPADIARFKADPELQREAAEHFVRELGNKYQWDPAQMRRGYYGLTSDPDAKQRLADGRAMPSSNEDTAKFMAAFGDVERPDGSDAPAKLPWDNTLLESMVKDKPSMKTLPRKVTYGDQERYLLSKVKNPEQLGILKDYIGAVSGLAKGERETAKGERDDFEKDMTQYGENVRKDAQLKFDTWKEGQDATERTQKRKDETLSALRTQRESLQKQLQDVRLFEQRAAAGKEPVDLLSAAYPEFYSTHAGEPGFLDQLVHGGDATAPMETKLDTKKLTQRAKDIQAEIDSIDKEVSSRSKAKSISNDRPAEGNPLSRYLTPR